MKRRIGAIYILCLISVVGIFFLQSSYINHLYGINKNQMLKELNLALELSTQKYLNLTFTNLAKFDYSNNNTAYLSVNRKSEHSLEIDSIMKGIEDRTETNSSIELSFSPQKSGEKLGDSIPDQIQINVKEILYLLINEEVNNARPINLVLFDSLFSDELIKRELSFEHYLEVIKTDNDSIIQFTGNPNSDTINSLCSTSFLISIIKTKVIRARIANEKQIIFDRLSWALFTSITLIIILLFSFFLMINTIFKQKQLSQIRSDFINNMTHELKTPISTVSAAIESMQNFGVLDDRDKTALYLNISSRELKRLSSLVEKVLNMAKEERKAVQLNFETIDIRSICQNLINSQQIKDLKKEVKIELDISPQASYINADYIHFSNVLHNLVENSIKYAKAGVDIHISTNITPHFIELKIQDNGIGIAKKHQNKIFDQFYRVPTGDVHNVKGFGLGLFYVNKIIQRHGGKIEVKSILGKGTTFIIKLPA